MADTIQRPARAHRGRRSLGNRLLDIITCRGRGRSSVTNDTEIVVSEEIFITPQEEKAHTPDVPFYSGSPQVVNDAQPNVKPGDATQDIQVRHASAGGLQKIEAGSTLAAASCSKVPGEPFPPDDELDSHSQVKESVGEISHVMGEYSSSDSPDHDDGDSARTAIAMQTVSTRDRLQPKSVGNSLRSLCRRIVSASPLRSNVQEVASSKAGELSLLTQTASSLVTFVLETVQGVGSNLPGIGVVGVVLSVLRKFKIEESNREETEDVLAYIEELCIAIEPPGGPLLVDIPSPSMDSGELSKKLRNVSKGLKKRNKNLSNRALGVINAESDEKELKAIWEGINLAQALYQAKALTEVHQVVMSEKDKEEERRMNDLINTLAHAKGASFDSYRTKKMALCSQGTRVDVLKTIQDWATNLDDDQGHIFWLNGLAGTGKSTLSMSIADWAKRQDILGGSFFFSRDITELQNAALVFPTFAAQLAQYDLKFKRALCDVLRKKQTISSEGFTSQYDGLIRQPLSACEGRRPILIVLDALDECHPEDDVEEILRVLLGSSGSELRGSKLRVFVASRPEAHIRSIFDPRAGGHHTQVVLHNIEESIVRNDIRTYLKAEFSRLATHFQISNDWAPEVDFESLLSDCGQFFEYAATAVRFIGDSRIRHPRKQLRKILDVNSSNQGTSRLYSNLDRLYLGVLETTVSENFDKEDLDRINCVIATTILLRDPMSVDNLAAFLSISVNEIRTALYHLHSVIIVPPPDHPSRPIRAFHPSFPDFLKDSTRCTDERFLVNTPKHENFMLMRCMEVMYTELGSVTVVCGEIEGVLAGALQYACTHWLSHISYTNLNDECLRKLCWFAGDSAAFRKWSSVGGFESFLDARISIMCWELKRWQFVGSENLLHLLSNRQAELKVDITINSTIKPRRENKLRRKLGKCSEGTCTKLLDLVKHWAESDAPDRKHIFWLNGMLGTGKTTLTRTIAEWAKRKGLVVTEIRKGFKKPIVYAKFDRGELNDIEHVLFSIAYQLADSLADYRIAFFGTFMRNYYVNYHFDFNSKKSFRTSFRELFHKFITEPLATCNIRHVSTTGTILCVLDPLSGHDGLMKEILETLLDESARMPVSFLVLVSTQPRFRTILEGNAQVTSAKMEEYVTKDDIRTYLATGLKRIREDSLPTCADWPRPIDLDLLTKKCGNLFVYASAILDFIGEEEVRDPMKRLQVVLADEVRLPSLESTYDKFSHSVFGEYFDLESEPILILQTIASLRTPLSFSELLVFLRTDQMPLESHETRLRDLCESLQSVLIFPPADPFGPNRDAPLLIFHHSFRDFLLEMRGRSFAEILMLLSCFDLMARLPAIHDMSIDPGASVDQGATVQKIFGAMKYVCIHWAEHVKAYCNTGNARDSTIEGDGDDPAVDSSPIGQHLLIPYDTPKKYRKRYERDIVRQENTRKDLTQRMNTIKELGKPLALLVHRSLLRWLHAMRQLGLVVVAVTSLRDVHSLVQTGTINCDEDAIGILRDAEQFVSEILKTGAPNTLDAFETAWHSVPRDTLFYRTYYNRDEGVEADEPIRRGSSGSHVEEEPELNSIDEDEVTVT